MNSPNTPLPSKHIFERTREWFRKAEHELAFLQYALLTWPILPRIQP
jgi:hypothetical protein